MSTALWPLQVAIVTKLRASAPLTALCSVFDSLPDDEPMPYVTVGSVFQLPSDNHSDRGLTVYMDLDIWSEYRGNSQAAQILAAVDAALDRQPLTVTGWTHVSVALEQANTVTDPNPGIRHIKASYRVWLTKA